MEKKQRRAVALFSGGLDSTLAMKLIKDQGVDVVAVNFVSHFFGGKNPNAEKMCEQIGVKLEYVDIKPIHTEIVNDPQYGYGKNMNPCVDCHGLMMRYANEELMARFDADFIISGEVLGQRPKSQNGRALEIVKKLSGVEDLIVRPMSAKLLPESKPEREGWIDREKLADVSGRSRKPQIEMAEKFGIEDFPSPAGGCLLTDPGYSRKLRVLLNDGLIKEENSELFYLLKLGRFFRMDKGKYIFVSRNGDESSKLEEHIKVSSLLIEDTKEVHGPLVLGFGEINAEDTEFAKQLFSRYCKLKGKERVPMVVDGEPAEIPALDIEAVEAKMKEHLV
ncbi:tRNA 2-thiouridine(34) synthase MnmA (plasmid) [Fulvitalea axinellae]|uniref:tRNA 2-thiouridine(34) synthase MnmA n=1 Tax=Fulvitalea axinellae TaxID=1182444 RepID=A0AAU9CX31_9BACT|nr:tRNA 2-thiouridine(34) synthase MnmA [Fulvitalea axinellae]